MSIVKTDLRNTRERAKEIRFYPADAITATNVQDAIEQVGVALLAPVATAVTFAMSPYIPLAADTLLMVDTTGGPVVISMPPSASRERDLEVKDAVGNSAVNSITVDADGAELIDGLGNYVLDSPYASAKFGPKTAGYYVHA